MTHPALLDPLVKALVERLPREGEPFSKADAERWLVAMEAAFRLLCESSWVDEVRHAIEAAVVSTTTADAVDNRTEPPVVPEAALVSGAPSTAFEERSSKLEVSTEHPATPEAVPSTDPPKPEKRRNFTHDQKAAFVREAVRDGVSTVSERRLIHESVLRRWMREMPATVQDAEREVVEEEAQALVGELEEEAAQPTPPRPGVQWPSAPMERRPFDESTVRAAQAEST